MLCLSDIQPTAPVRGILPGQVVTVVSVRWFGSEALEGNFKNGVWPGRQRAARMNVFDLRNRLVGDYASYTPSFIKIADPAIARKVETELDAGAFWPEPMLQLNPTFLPGGTIDELVATGRLHAECNRIFRIDKSDADHSGKPHDRLLRCAD